MLNVLFVASWYPSDEEPFSGQFIKEHAKAVSLSNDVLVIANTEGPRSQNRLCEVSETVEDGIRVIRVKSRRHPVSKIRYFIQLWSMSRILWRTLRDGYRADIIHAHVFFAGLPAVIFGRLYNIPVVITEHYSGFPMGNLSFVDKLMARFVFRWASVILPVSDYLRQHIERYGNKNKLHVVPNVVDTDVFLPGTDRVKEKGARTKLLTVASLVSVKGFPFLLEALKEIKAERDDFVLDIVGDGPNRAEYEKLAVDLSINKQVRFHGAKSREEVAVFMRECDFYVSSSVQETFGVTLIEALASGKPVVSTKSGGPNDLINDKVGRLVPPRDPGALAEAIIYLLNHFEDYSPEEISLYARERFSYETVGREIKKIYGELVKSGDRRH